MLPAVENDGLVGLVGVDAEALLRQRPEDPGHRGKVQDHQPGLLAHHLGQVVSREGEPGVLPEADRSRDRPHVADERLEQRVAGGRIHDLVAALAVRLLREADGSPGTGEDHHPVGVDLGQTPPRGHVAGHGPAQLQQPLRVAIGGVAVLYGLPDGSPDVLRKRKVGLAQVATDDILSELLGLADEGRERERLLGAQEPDTVGIEPRGSPRDDGGHTLPPVDGARVLDAGTVAPAAHGPGSRPGGAVSQDLIVRIRRLKMDEGLGPNLWGVHGTACRDFPCRWAAKRGVPAFRTRADDAGSP